jgi:putative membrane protein
MSATKINPHTPLLFLFFGGLLFSSINPHDYFTWFLEIFPALLGLIALVITYKRFQFTTLTYWLILVHCYILFVGGHYTYAEVPLFDWIRDTFHQSRNNYDKVGHFAQGFVPAVIVRELFIRGQVVKRGGWLSFLTITVCVFISVVYEFIEWLVAELSGQDADAFLGTQGYVWDTQSDMLMATIGAISMLVMLGRIQDRAIARFSALK